MTLIVKTQIWTSDVWMFIFSTHTYTVWFWTKFIERVKSLYPFSWHMFSDLNYFFLAGYIHNTSIICHSNVSNSMNFFYIIVNDWISWYYYNEDLDIFYTSLLLDNKNQLCAMLLILIFKQRWHTWYMCLFYT